MHSIEEMLDNGSVPLNSFSEDTWELLLGLLDQVPELDGDPYEGRARKLSLKHVAEHIMVPSFDRDGTRGEVKRMIFTIDYLHPGPDEKLLDIEVFDGKTQSLVLLFRNLTLGQARERLKFIASDRPLSDLAGVEKQKNHWAVDALYGPGTASRVVYEAIGPLVLNKVRGGRHGTLFSGKGPTLTSTGYAFHVPMRTTGGREETARIEVTLNDSGTYNMSARRMSGTPIRTFEGVTEGRLASAFLALATGTQTDDPAVCAHLNSVRNAERALEALGSVVLQEFKVSRDAMWALDPKEGIVFPVILRNKHEGKWATTTLEVKVIREGEDGHAVEVLDESGHQVAWSGLVPEGELEESMRSLLGELGEGEGT